MREDVLMRLDRILDATPEHVHSTPPLPRQLVAQAAAEIRMLRARLAQKLASSTHSETKSKAE